MGTSDTSMGDGSVQYYSGPKKSAENEFDIVPILVVGGVLGAIGLAAYTVNKQFYKNSFIGMGTGRRYNNNYIRNFAMGIQDLEDLPDFERRELSTMSPYVQRQYRTHNILYPDIMYEGVTKQARPDNTFVSVPIPPSHVTRTQLTYAEPSNIVTDAILYEHGTPDIREDYRITGEIPGTGKGRYNRRFTRYAPGGIDEGASNTVFTTEYAPGINEKVRRDNPVVVSGPVVTPSGRVLRKVGRMQSVDIPSRSGRRFNKDYDELGQPLQPYDPIYDTYDALSDLKLTNEDFGEGEAGGRISDDSLKVFEDFVSKGKLRQGWEIIPSED